MNVKKFLQQHDVAFDLVEHRPTQDARSLAQAVHVSPAEVAKTVLLKLNGGHSFAVAVLPASRYVDLDKAGEALGVRELELATEREVEEHCPDCEVGALPPFGKQYDMETYMDASLAEDQEIVFDGNTHSEAFRISMNDFLTLEEPEIVSLASEEF